jgi:hemerythrin-like domain-containing protein
LESIEIARSHLYASCVADLAFYVINEHCLNDIQGETIQFILSNLVNEVFSFAKDDENIFKAFDEMKKQCEEQIKALKSDAIDHKLFKMSSDTFYRWAPMAEEFKTEDEEIMRNSIHFRWIEVRREVRERIRPSLMFN